MELTASNCTIQMKIRVPEELRDLIALAADHSMRTHHGEIVWRLAQSFDDHPVRPLKGAGGAS